MAVNEAAKLGSPIKDAASTSKSVLIEATVQTRDDGSTPMVILSSEDAVRVISAHAPRIIYLVEQVF
nr:L445 [uncultured bacterium]